MYSLFLLHRILFSHLQRIEKIPLCITRSTGADGGSGTTRTNRALYPHKLESGVQSLRTGSGSRFVNILRGMVKLVIYMTSAVHQVKLESLSYLRSVGWHTDSAKSTRARTRALVVAFNGCRLTISIHSNWMDAAWLSHTTTTEARNRS